MCKFCNGKMKLGSTKNVSVGFDKHSGNLVITEGNVSCVILSIQFKVCPICTKRIMKVELGPIIKEQACDSYINSQYVKIIKQFPEEEYTDEDKKVIRNMLEESVTGCESKSTAELLISHYLISRFR